MNPSSLPHSKHSGPAILLLNGKAVGLVQARGRETSWSFGDFSPNEAFSDFAPFYGTWSNLMHADSDADRLSSEAVEELRIAEALLDSIRAQLVYTEESVRVDVASLTIDGNQLEWREY